MGHPGRRQPGPGWDHEHEERRQHRGHRRGGPHGERGRGPGGPGGHGGAPWGPPPWLHGFFGSEMGPTSRERGRGPRVRRGDVRSAILDVLAAADRDGEGRNGYQVIQEIAERTDGRWRPSPGSVYPTVSQLQDEGLVETDPERGRKALALTDAGVTYVQEHADELAAVWRPFTEDDAATAAEPGLRPEVTQVMGAVWQITTTGSDSQREAAAEILADARRRLYGVLADGPS